MASQGPEGAGRPLVTELVQYIPHSAVVSHRGSGRGICLFLSRHTDDPNAKKSLDRLDLANQVAAGVLYTKRWSLQTAIGGRAQLRPNVEGRGGLSIERSAFQSRSGVMIQLCNVACRAQFGAGHADQAAESALSGYIGYIEWSAIHHLTGAPRAGWLELAIGEQARSECLTAWQLTTIVIL